MVQGVFEDILLLSEHIHPESTEREIVHYRAFLSQYSLFQVIIIN